MANGSQANIYRGCTQNGRGGGVMLLARSDAIAGLKSSRLSVRLDVSKRLLLEPVVELGPGKQPAYEEGMFPMAKCMKTISEP